MIVSVCWRKLSGEISSELTFVFDRLVAIILMAVYTMKMNNSKNKLYVQRIIQYPSFYLIFKLYHLFFLQKSAVFNDNAAEGLTTINNIHNKSAAILFRTTRKYLMSKTEYTFPTRIYNQPPNKMIICAIKSALRRTKGIILSALCFNFASVVNKVRETIF